MLNVKTKVFVSTFFPFLLMLIFLTPVTPFSFKPSRTSWSEQPLSMGSRMIPLKELREVCAYTLTFWFKELGDFKEVISLVFFTTKPPPEESHF